VICSIRDGPKTRNLDRQRNLRKMRICLFDPFCGIAGDMALAALLDAGCSLTDLQGILDTLNIPPVKLMVKETRKHTLRALRLAIEGDLSFRMKHTDQILRLIDQSSLSTRAKERASSVFRVLEAAEARAHGVEPGQAHFHEVGALDSLVDIIGVAAATDLLQIDSFFSYAVPLPRGQVETEHGRVPLPAPATLELLKGVPTTPQRFDGETVTPTGAALIAGLGCRFEVPAMKVIATGCGAGTADFPEANIIRVIIGESTETASEQHAEFVAVVETTIDDMNPQFYEPLCERLTSEGALEVFLTPVQMRKFRPGVLVTILAPVEKMETIAATLLAHTTTIGCRTRVESRRCLPRRVVDVATSLGNVRVKVADLGGAKRAAPEFEDVRNLADELGRTLPDVMAQILVELSQKMG
jgi:hypothetical protein